MDDDNQWQRMIDGLRKGDSLVARDFYAQYGPVLQRIADRHLPDMVRRRVGAEDVVQSACRTFLRRAEGGEFQLTDDSGLWQLLCAITLSKVRGQARYHLRQKRGLSREQEPDPNSSQVPGQYVAAPGPGPDEAAAFSDQFQRLLEELDEEDRQIVNLKLQEFTNDQVADQLGCSERTVRRTLKRLQSKFLAAFEVT
jgi:RNA polymerase sigma factor (sigma-70 family)